MKQLYIYLFIILILLYIFICNTKTDQPIRYIAVFVVAPLLFYKGYIYKDPLLISIAAGLFGWDLYSILYRSPTKY